MAGSFGQYFQDAYLQSSNKTGYTRAHYDVAPLCNARIIGTSGNILSRLKNELSAGLNRYLLPPKAIIIVVDDDIMDELDHYKPGFSQAIGRILEKLASKIHKIVTGYKEKLPSKSRKFKYPTVLWTEIPLHEVYGHYNEYKEKYNKALADVSNLYREMEVLPIGNTRRQQELNYFSQGRLNSNGLTTYWQAIDKAFENWDREQMKQRSSTMPSSTVNPKNSYFEHKHLHRERQHNYDKYHWKASDTRFRLPPPDGDRSRR